MQGSTVAQRDSGDLILPFLYSRREMAVSGQCHVLAALTQRKRHDTNCTEGWVGQTAGADGC
jgi:hypothetical protein